MRRTLRIFGVAAGLAVATTAGYVAVQLWPASARQSEPAAATSPVAPAVEHAKYSGLPLPRFVSLKARPINVRRGPSMEHPIAWQFTKRGLPVEIVQETESWRQIRYADGAEGWVYHSLLSGRRTAVVAPWDDTGTLRGLRAEARTKAGLVAQLEPDVLVEIKRCGGEWCEIEAGSHTGFIEQGELWGVYPREVIE
jgi:SH3-like domain-containing protein